MTAGHRPLIYEVDLVVDPDTADAFAAWLHGHVREVLASDGFIGAEWLDVDTEGGEAVRWCVRYTVRDHDALEAYFAGPARALRADGEARFRGRFRATRRVLAVREVIG